MPELSPPLREVKLLLSQSMHRKLSDSTISLYVHTIKRIAHDFTGREFESIEFLKDATELVEWLKSRKSSAVLKTALSVCIVLCSPSRPGDVTPSYEHAWQVYQGELSTLNKTLASVSIEQFRSDKQIRNWQSWSDVERVPLYWKKKLEKRGFDFCNPDIPFDKMYMKTLADLQKYVVTSIYTMIPPRRLEYRSMKWKDCTVGDIEYPSKGNWCVMTPVKSFFVFNVYKTARKFGSQIIELPRNLYAVLKVWFAVRKTPWLLFNQHYTPYTGSAFCNYVQRCFSPLGVQNFGATMARSTYLSYKYKAQKKERKKDAEMMAHSEATADQHYIKHLNK